MGFYHYEIAGKRIGKYNDVVSGVPKEFHHYTDKSFGEGDIYYKSRDGKVIEIICETSLGQVYAQKVIQEFVDNLTL